MIFNLFRGLAYLTQRALRQMKLGAPGNEAEEIARTLQEKHLIRNVAQLKAQEPGVCRGSSPNPRPCEDALDKMVRAMSTVVESGCTNNTSSHARWPQQS